MALAAGVLTWLLLAAVVPIRPVDINVRWADGTDAAARAARESRLSLTAGEQAEGTTWRYRLADPSTTNIRALVQDPAVADTHRLNRLRFRPEFAQDRARHLMLGAALAGVLVASLWLFVAAGSTGGAARRAQWRAEQRALLPATDGSFVADTRFAAAVCAAGIVFVAVVTLAAGGAPVPALLAWLVILVSGYGVGALFVPAPPTWAWAVMRSAAGLMLSGIGYLLSLAGDLPWFVVPVAMVLVVSAWRRRACVAGPPVARLDARSAAGLLLAAVVVSPILVSCARMAPGAYPPVIYNVDTAYSLEKVHSLVAADGFPPPSLGNLGVRRTYHYGTQAMAALVARAAGLPPHQALFLVTVPLFVCALLAAALTVAARVAPAVPPAIAVPLLLVSVPSLSRGFWQQYGPWLWSAASSGRLSIDALVGDVGLWGILSNEAQNVGGDFLILGTLAGLASLSTVGWLLPAFLVGAGIIFKTTGGIALVAGVGLAETWRVARRRQWLPSPGLLLTAVWFAATYGIFFLASFDSAFRVELYPLQHLRETLATGGLAGLVADLVWLLAPALPLVGVAAGTDDGGRRGSEPDAALPSATYLWMAAGPLVVMNTTALVHVGNGGQGAGLDWVQISHVVPFVVHACVLHAVSRRWDRLGTKRRWVVVVALVAALAPVVTAAARYSLALAGDARAGHEMADSRSIAEALAVVPVRGSVIVTNDLRYPADGFSRDDRQLQIPALFGHQAYSANFSYEPIDDRRPQQRLLQAPAWSEAIVEAARRHGWTHLLIRKDYVHPEPIPLPRQFDNADYAVYRFP